MEIDMLKRVTDKILAAADKLEQDSAYSGSWGDNGANQLRRDVSLFIDGFNKTFPKAWDKYVKEVENSLDPEYKQYLEMKKKFER